MSAQTKQTMRRFFLIALAALSLTWVTYSLAAVESTKSAQTASPTPADSAINDKKIQELKDKLATKVAQLRDNEKKGFYGEVTTLSKATFTLLTPKGEIKVRFTEDTLYFKAGKTRTSAKPEDLKNGVFASVLGLFDSDNKEQNAKVILIENKVKFVEGQLTAVDKDNGKFTVKTSEDTLSVDYEKTTNADELVTATKKIGKSGFSRFAVGDQILIWGTPSDDDAKALTAVRIMRLPGDLFNVAGATTASPTSSAKPTPQASVSPSPTTKATPKASAKS